VRRYVSDSGVIVDAEVVAHHSAGDEFRFAGGVIRFWPTRTYMKNFCAVVV
jgi:hypothetical protein